MYVGFKTCKEECIVDLNYWYAIKYEFEFFYYKKNDLYDKRKWKIWLMSIYRDSIKIFLSEFYFLYFTPYQWFKSTVHPSLTVHILNPTYKKLECHC